MFFFLLFDCSFFFFDFLRTLIPLLTTCVVIFWKLAQNLRAKTTSTLLWFCYLNICQLDENYKTWAKLISFIGWHILCQILRLLSYSFSMEQFRIVIWGSENINKHKVDTYLWRAEFSKSKNFTFKVKNESFSRHFS